MVSYLLPLLTMILVNGLFVHLSRHSFGEMIPVSFMVSVLVLFLSQYLCHTYSFGIYLVLAAAAAGLVVLILKKETRTRFFTAGLTAFLAGSLFAILWDYNRHFSDFDEFWHWGMMVKESLRLDSFHCVEESNMMVHKDYPPFLPILELLWSKLGRAYSEGLITAALHTFSFSMVLPVAAEQLAAKKTDPKDKTAFWKNLLTALCHTATFLVLAEALDHARIFNTILADFPLGVTFG